MHEMTLLMTMVTAISAGILLMILAHRWSIPAIATLLFGGLLLGPQGLGLVQPASLGDGLKVLVSLAVSLILFEGGLTLNLEGYRQASGVIRRLLSLGALATWLLTAGAVELLFEFEARFSLLIGSFVIVTGPTVIGPLLKRINVNDRLRNILHWEGVLIDPIGVFIVLLCYEILVDIQLDAALFNFALRFVSGIGIGLGGGILMHRLLTRHLVPEEMINIFVFAGTVLIFGVTESLLSEAGLLSVTVAGLYLGARLPAGFESLRQFKSEITDLAIGILFILLTARLEFKQFASFGWHGVLLVGAILFVVRPVNILLSTWGSELTRNERLFLSWVAPRGIVAASMASLFSLELAERGVVGATFIETFTFTVIFSTIVLQGFTAEPLARWLGVKRPAPSGWILIGAHALSRGVARYLRDSARQPVVLLDSNPDSIHEASQEGLHAILADAREVGRLAEHPALQGLGHLLALTDNEELNLVLCQRWMPVVGKSRVFRWGSDRFRARPGLEPVGSLVWSKLSKPSQISQQLLDGKAELSEVEPSGAWLLLLAIQNDTPDFQPKGKALGMRLNP